MMKKCKLNRKAGWTALMFLAVIICTIGMCDVAYASEDEENYATITVEATDDASGVYQYALDSTDDTAWQSSNTFRVLPGTTHTVYVKDAAGNITSREVHAEGADPEETAEYDGAAGGSEPTQTDVADTDQEDPYAAGVGAGSGTATVTDYVDDDSKEFYTVTTANGNQFYLIIDHRNSDDNVYFTKAVSELDLLTLAAEAGEVEDTVVEQAQVQQPVVTPAVQEPEEDGKDRNAVKEYLPYILVLAAACGGYYYFMIYKKKKESIQEYDEDAADMEQFIPVEDDDDSALFSYKGNSPSPDGEEDTDDLIDEFYNNNSEDDYGPEFMNEYDEETEMLPDDDEIEESVDDTESDYDAGVSDEEDDL